ncbi:MAG: hypothetical protein P4L64_16485 [Caulobacteraceae bacterium]|nr:hypothetical protein [Caulobacteraceae bacterium]
MGKTAVVYLSRHGNPARLTQGFLASLARYRPGADFDLVFLLKGYGPGQGDPVLEQHRGALGREVIELRMPDDGFSIDADLFAARALAGYERLLFLTSFSLILADDWLAHYLAGFASAPDCGAIGATGSYEAIGGGAFPNPHLRTNAFMIARDLLLDIDPGPLTTKAGNAQFEAGPRGLTAQLRERGLAPLVVDRWGAVWPQAQWRESRTFRAGDQEGLLIADNRTHDYQAGPHKRRRKLARLAWGDDRDVPRLGTLERWRREWAWNHPPKP